MSRQASQDCRQLVLREAIVSGCGRYRYRLTRRWSDGPSLAFVMLNPSKADAEVDDATIRRCIGFAQRAGFGGLDAINLYAYRATHPSDLRRAGYPVGPENDEHIIAAARECAAVCVARRMNTVRKASGSMSMRASMSRRTSPRMATRSGCLSGSFSIHGADLAL